MLVSAQKRYTYREYAEWPEKPRYELIDGVPYIMYAPSLAHQEILMELLEQFRIFLRGKTCKVIMAPFDVRLQPLPNGSDDTAVQPDLLVVCDPKKLEDGKSCKGAPDLIVEILSPSTAGKDRLIKFRRYLRAGVREYWIVDPEGQNVFVHLLEETPDKRYIIQGYGREDLLPVTVLDGFTIDLSTIFPLLENIEPEAEESERSINRI